MYYIIFYASLTILVISPAIQGVVTISKVVVRVPNPNDMGLIFDVNVANTAGARKEPLEYLIRSDGTCTINLTECETMKNAGRILGGNFGLIQAGSVDTASLIWPTISLYNRVGVCPVVLTTRNANDAQIHIRQLLHFDTRFSTLDPEGHTFRKQRDYKDCQNWDKDYLKNCTPVKCIERYFGQRSFYNRTSERCEEVPRCGRLFEKYNKYTNECVNNRRFCTARDIKLIRMGQYQEDEAFLSPELPQQAKAFTSAKMHNKNKPQEIFTPAGKLRPGKPQSGKATSAKLSGATKDQSKSMNTVPAAGADPDNARGLPAEKTRGPTPDHAKGPTHENAKFALPVSNGEGARADTSRYNLADSRSGTGYSGAQNRVSSPADTNKYISADTPGGFAYAAKKNPYTGSAALAHNNNKHSPAHGEHAENSHSFVVADITLGMTKIKSPKAAAQPNDVPPGKGPSALNDEAVALAEEDEYAGEDSEAAKESADQAVVEDSEDSETAKDNIDQAAEEDEAKSQSWVPYWLKGLADGLLIVLATIAIYVLICFMIFLIVTWLARRHSESGNKTDCVVCSPHSVVSNDDFTTRTSSSLLAYGH